MRFLSALVVVLLFAGPARAEEPSNEAIIAYGGASIAMVNGAGLAFYGLIRPFTTPDVPSERGLAYMAGGIGLMGAAVALFAVANALPKNVEASRAGVVVRF